MNGSQHSRFKLIAAFLTVGIISLVQPGCDCSSSSDNTIPPQTPAIVSIDPANDSTTVLVGSSVSAVFRDDMDAMTIDDTTFTLTQNGIQVPVVDVVYVAKTATLIPSSDLLPNTQYIAT
ncbi:MAG: Ig-like domain-containing protein, partial [Gammaproteobacteria bacterium]